MSIFKFSQSTSPVPGKQHKERKYFALFILAILALFFFYASFPLLLGISGAAILYVLLKPIYLKLERKLGNKCISAVLVLLLSLLLIILPIFGIAYLAFIDISDFLANPENIAQFASVFPDETLLDAEEFVKAHIMEISNFATGLSLTALDTTVSILVNLTVMYIILYYLLTENKKASRAMKNILPFTRKNTEKLAAEFSNVINATFLGNGIVAIMMGVLFGAGLYLMGASNVFFWTVAGTISAIIPIIGMQLVWIPIALYYIFEGSYFTAGAIALWGAFLSYIFDGYARQFVQKKIAEIHPFVSIIGLIIGVTYFGVTGIIIGPLLIALFVLIAKIFREEYLPAWS